MTTRWIWLGFMLVLSACTPSDGDNNATDMGSDASSDLNPTAEKCEAIAYDGDIDTLGEFQNRCVDLGCELDSVWPTYEKGGRCFYEDRKAEDWVYKCFSSDSGSNQGMSSFVNRETGEVLVFNSGFRHIDGWIPCQGRSPGDEDAMPAEHICWTCAPDWDWAM